MTAEREKKIKAWALHQLKYVLMAGVVLLLVHDIFGTHGFLAMRRKQTEIQKVKADLDRLGNENIQLEQHVKDLRTDPQTIETIAREEMGQAKPGEIVIKLQAQAPAEQPAAKP